MSLSESIVESVLVAQSDELDAPTIAIVPHRKDTEREHLDEHLTIIQSRTGWQVIDFAEAWRFRELLYFMVWRDVKVRYKQTVLGVAWALIQPLMTMVVFTVFFGRLAKMASDGVPYPLFAFVALAPWTYVATAVSNGAVA